VRNRVDGTYRRRGNAWRVGPLIGWLGVGTPATVGHRPEVGDDGRGPLVSGSSRRPGAGPRWAELGRQRSSRGRREVLRRAGPGIKGAFADFANLG
jgi:hypothetical protein